MQNTVFCIVLCIFYVNLVTVFQITYSLFVMLCYILESIPIWSTFTRKNKCNQGNVSMVWLTKYYTLGSLDMMYIYVQKMC